MEIHHLRSFVTVADSGRVSKAARQLHLAQPAVSQHLHALERELGVILFERAAQGMILTDAGLALLGQARDVLARLTDFKSAAERFTLEEQNQVSIAMTPSLAASLMPGVLELLQVTRSKVRVLLYERPTEDSLSLLAAGNVVMSVVRDAAGTGFQTRPIFEEPLVLAVSTRNQVLREAPNRQLSDFRDEPFVFFRHTGREALFTGPYSACLQAGFTPTIISEGVEADSMGQIVMANIACCIAPLSVVRLWDLSQIRVLPMPVPAPRSTVYVARVADRVMPQPAQRVLRAVVRAAKNFDVLLLSTESELGVRQAPAVNDADAAQATG